MKNAKTQAGLKNSVTTEYQMSYITDIYITENMSYANTNVSGKIPNDPE